MTINQTIGYKMLNTSALTDLVSTRITHGNVPAKYTSAQSVIFPAVNFFELAGNPIVGITNGATEQRQFQISCRDYTAKGVKAIADQVEIMWQNLHETINGFSINLSKIVLNGGQIYEPETKIFHIPLTIRVTFNSGEA